MIITLVGADFSANNISGTVQLTAENAINYDSNYHLGRYQLPGSALAKSTDGTLGIYTWNIPKNAIVTVTVKGGGQYGMALTDSNDIVMQAFSNDLVSSDASITGDYTLCQIPHTSGKLHVSAAKFVSASYTMLTSHELSNYQSDLGITMMQGTHYVDQKSKQTVGSPVVLASMSGTGYGVSAVIPTNAITMVNVTSGGNYGMVLTDLNGNVVQAKNNGDASNGVLTFDRYAYPTRLYVSRTKYQSGTYKTGA